MKEKVLLINYTGRFGSGNIHAYVMTKALADKGEKIVAIVSSYAENINQWRNLNICELIEVKTYNNKAQFVGSSFLFYCFGAKELSKYIEKKYIVKAIYCPMLTFWSYAINKQFDCKIIVCNHDPIPHSGDKKRIMITKNYKYSDIIIVHSRMFVDYVKKEYPDKIVKYMPLTRLNTYDLENKIKAINYDPQKTNFLFFGTISKYKGLEFLADAFKLIRKNFDCVTLTICGNGNFKDYKDKYDGIADVTIINRWIKDEEVESFFDGDNVVLVLPYIDATQSGVALVAKEYGVPIIGTRTGGLTEQIDDGKTGVIVEPSSVDSLYDGMRKFVDDKEFYYSIKNNIINVNKETDDGILAEQLLNMI